MADFATKDQKAYLDHLGVSYPSNISKERAAELIQKAKAKGKGSYKPKGSIWAGLRAIFIFALLACLGLALWPQKEAGDGSASLPEQVEAARAVLSTHFRAKQAKRPNEGQLTEREINAYLHDILAKNTDESSGLSAPPELLNVDLQDDAMNVLVRARYYGMPLTYLVRVIPNSLGSQDFAPKATHAHIGHLPLPPPLREMIAGRVANTFSGMKDEAALWHDLDNLTVEPGRLNFSRAQ